LLAVTSERKHYSVSEAVVEQRRNAATRHGGQSEHRIKAVARAHKRRFLRQTGLKIADLDGIALGLIDNWARAQSKVSILDEFFSEQGLVREGEVDPALRVTSPGSTPPGWRCGEARGLNVYEVDDASLTVTTFAWDGNAFTENGRRAFGRD
jgi:hypothetical protein